MVSVSTMASKVFVLFIGEFVYLFLVKQVKYKSNTLYYFFGSVSQ